MVGAYRALGNRSQIIVSVFKDRKSLKYSGIPVDEMLTPPHHDDVAIAGLHPRESVGVEDPHIAIALVLAVPPTVDHNFPAYDITFTGTQVHSTKSRKSKHKHSIPNDLAAVAISLFVGHASGVDFLPGEGVDVEDPNIVQVFKFSLAKVMPKTTSWVTVGLVYFRWGVRIASMLSWSGF